MILWLIWGLAVIAAAWIYFRHAYSYYKNRGVKSDQVFPPFGSLTKVLLKQEHFLENFKNMYVGFPQERFVGRYEFTRPVLVVRDLDLIKRITIKDFEHFLDHREVIPEKADPIFARTLVILKGQEWKDMRSTLSPAFTSSKMKHMVPFMVEVGDQMVDNLKKTIKEKNSEYLEIDVKDLTTRYANDVIASCAFGLKVNSHIDKENEFYKQGLVVSSFKFKQLIILILIYYFPWLTKQFNVKIFGEGTYTFFRGLVTFTMQDRETKNIIRPDMIHLLMEAKKGKLSHDDRVQDADAGFATVEESSVGKKTVNRVWADDDLVAQAVIFFAAGFETVSSAMTFLLFELALNPEVQDKLAAEIKEMEEETGGKFDYNRIMRMTYMDMVVSEVLRKWPPGPALDRLCIKDYNLGKPNDKATRDYIMKKGEGLQIPVMAIHHDPQYFPDPDKFDPERFSEENRHNIKPCTYNPFGLGPRNCIGSRFALCEVKIIAYHLLLHFEISPGPKTPIPIQLDKDSFNMKVKGGNFLNFKVRS